VIVKFDGQEVTRMHELPWAASRTPLGREVQVAVVRHGKVHDLAATMTRLPEAQVPARSGPAR
jgi:S1-C subfamily serine protease